VAHHDARLAEIAAATAARGDAGATAWDMVPTLFPRHLDNNQVVFAFAETLAHMHCLETRGHVERRTGADGVHRFVATAPAPAEAAPLDDTEDALEVGPV
jgi:hypothetical protein